MYKIFLILFLLLYGCGRGSSPGTQTLNTDVVLLQDAVGVNKCQPNQFKNYTNYAKRWGDSLWSDTEICHFKKGTAFTQKEIATSIDNEINYVDKIGVYALCCLNSQNYDSRITAVFIYSSPLSKVKTKLKEFTSIDTVIIQFWHDNNIDNTNNINWLISNGYKVYVGFDRIDNWYPIHNTKEYILDREKMINKIKETFGNKIEGIYIPEEPQVSCNDDDLFDYYQSITNYAHSLGYKVAISPYLRCD